MQADSQPTRRAAYLISDTAHFSPDGRVERFGNKIAGISRFPAAMGLQGNLPLALFAAELRKVDIANVRTLLKLIPDALRRAIAAARLEYTASPEIVTTLRLAAWSARQHRPMGYACTTDAALAAILFGGEYGPYEMGEVTASLSCDVPLPELLGRPCDPCDPATFDPHEHAHEMVAAQRGRPMVVMTPGADESVPHWIGGWAELTEVTRRGYKVWRVGEPFPDRVGERIAA